jgi:ubiquitin carboxyl-terminal hydrolase L3
MAEARPRWLPLESNPDVINKFVSNLGMSTAKYEFTDVFGLDPELLMMVPKPVVGVLLLFPVSDAPDVGEQDESADGKVFKMKQTISNACGTVGVIHCIGNNLDNLDIEEGSYLDKYFKEVNGKSDEEIGHALEVAEGISGAHEESASEGQTEAPELEASVDLHFVCFVHHEGNLYELDGNKQYPVNHGATTADTLLEDTAAVARKFMARTPEDLRYSLVALAGKP